MLVFASKTPNATYSMLQAVHSIDLHVNYVNLFGHVMTIDEWINVREDKADSSVCRINWHR